ncbi:MAG: hypothetical protein GEV13_01020 [Rhodospirillales bacterium]|nr:hypothetical protein [Rhodospirillales bacterium]
MERVSVIVGRSATRAPFRDRHNPTTLQALVGGPRARSGEASAAYHGVLFLDETPDFTGIR